MKMKKAPVAVIILLVSVSPLFRGLYFNYETYAFMAALALASIMYFFGKIASNEPIHINKFSAVSGALLVLAAAAGFAKAVNARENLESLLQAAELLLIFFVLYDYFHDKKQRFITVVMLPMVFTGFACSIAGLMALAGPLGPLNFLDVTVFVNRVGTTFQYANTASIYFAVCIIFAFTLLNASGSALLRAVLAGMGSVLMLALLLTGSRGGYIAGAGTMLLLLFIQPPGCRLRGAVSFICMLLPASMTIKAFNLSAAGGGSLAAAKWLAVSFAFAAVLSLLPFLLLRITFVKRAPRMPQKPAILYVAAFVALMALVLAFKGRLISMLPPAIGGRLERFSLADNSILYRLEYDRDALKLIADNWLVGLGGGGWKAMYQSVQDFFYTAVFVHNNYLQVFVESGILGFLAYLALVAAGIFNAAYSYLRSPDKLRKIYTAGLLCGLLALAFHSAFDFDLSYASVSLLFWVMLAAAGAGMPEAPGTEGVKAPLPMAKRELPANRSLYKIAAIAAGSLLFSVNALYLAGAYNEYEALKHMQSKNYKAAATYYEEAFRLDPANSAYAFELAKLYNYFAEKSADEEDRQSWLEKARAAGENSVGGDRFYPAYMNTLARIYLASDRPLQALEYARRLTGYQRYNGENYELLARCCLAAGRYYRERGDTGNERQLLESCIEIGRNPYLLRSDIEKPANAMPREAISYYGHSERLSAYLKEAQAYLERLE